jgi:hypothetical protein
MFTSDKESEKIETKYTNNQCSTKYTGKSKDMVWFTTLDNHKLQELTVLSTWIIIFAGTRMNISI